MFDKVLCLPFHKNALMLRCRYSATGQHSCKEANSGLRQCDQNVIPCMKIHGCTGVLVHLGKETSGNTANTYNYSTQSKSGIFDWVTEYLQGMEMKRNAFAGVVRYRIIGRYRN